MRTGTGICLLFVFRLLISGANAQSDSTKSFKVGLEFRPRLEFRDGYRQLPNDTTQAALFISQRSRVNITFEQKNFKFHTSIQDIRIWGQYGQFSAAGSLNVFEAYVESYLTKTLFIRTGRQKLELDNGRLFAEANWNQAGRAHDGLNIIYKNEKITSELITSFSQSAERVFETHYSPAGFSNYKLLNVHYLKAQIHKHVLLTTLNSADGYESKTSPRTLYMRGTSGGRLEFEKGKLYATLSGYYQYGQLQSGKEISAYYFQPELKIKSNKLTARLGAEYMSGDDATKASAFSRSFVPLYGVAWRFMGNMDYFTTFPSDLKNGGLIDSYLFLLFELNKKLTLRADAHLFFLQNNVLDVNNNTIDPYLGFENDLSFKYKANEFTVIEGGFSYMFAQKSMEALKGGDSDRIPVWSYLMVTFKPELFSHKSK